MVNPLEAPIESVSRVDRRIIPALRRLGIRTVGDLLFHFPTRYEDFSNVKAISDIKVGETVTVRGIVEKVSVRRTFRKRMTLIEVWIKDESGQAKAIWFNQAFLAGNLKEGTEVFLSGKVAKGPDGMCLQNPSYERAEKKGNAIHTGGLVPVYPETRGVSSRWLRYLISTFIDARKSLEDPLPPEIVKRNTLLPFQQALYAIHFPKTRDEAKEAERRFSFEDLLLIQLHTLRERMRLKKKRAPEIPIDVPLIKEFVESLPFSLTDAQRRSLWEIANDLVKSSPMNRLLEGDVGSGKTVVAAASALLTVRAGYRVLCMAPTEILARQHLTTFQKLLAPFDVSIGFRLGSEKRDEHASVVVGTHALIKRNSGFENTGLIIVDEQHRFGVEQRAHLLKEERALTPHFLSMSATPIPRTLALAVYGDLDLSILDEMPKSRKAIITEIIEPKRRKETYEFIREEVKRGRQVFVICPRIDLPEESESATKKAYQQKLLLAEIKSVKEEYKKLSEEVFPDLSIAMLHGKMKAKEKADVMNRFKEGTIQILVSTSVVEVGVDIPNATVMMIEGAERFGLASLHQFRGRVGRGAEQSYCFLFPTDDGPISRRLRAVKEAKNGFELAEKDLEIRGPGDLFGVEQSGFSNDALRGIGNPELVRAVRREATELLKSDPSLFRARTLREKLEEMERAVHWE